MFFTNQPHGQNTSGAYLGRGFGSFFARESNGEERQMGFCVIFCNLGSNRNNAVVCANKSQWENTGYSTFIVWMVGFHTS